ncbi:MAG: 30S ribosomal protein S15 [Bacteroidetes bacterium]|nr:30S ribosomal protein S15 [Bacteroidota bacterium]
MKLTTETKKQIFKEYGGSDKNTGSTEAQVAIITHRINHLTGHLKNAKKKDHNTTLSLLKLVGQRKRFLSYLMSKDIEKYRALILKLNLRK